MATIKQIQFKRSNVAGKRPLPADIAEGELAINIKDSTLFTKNAEGQIIDLGFAKGGKVDGNITQVGNFNQTGNFTTSGDISARNVSVTTGINAGGEIVSTAGTLRTRAGVTSNSHVWFEGLEVGASKNYERAVLYASPQTVDGGAIRLRVQNGTGTDAGQALFVWNGAGDFQAPRDLYGQRSRLSIEVVAPTLNGHRLYTRDRVFGEYGVQSYGWEDTVNYAVGDNGAIALNYVYKGRAHVTGTIWHQLIDERTAPEWSLYTGSGPSNKMFSLRSVGTLGHAQVTGSLFIGGGSESLGYVSGMGEGSLALGDNDTGFRNDGDGMFSVMANSRPLIHYNSSAAKFQIEHRKATRITHTDNANATILPANNTSLLEIDTSLDNNNAGGNGLTLLGYNSSGKYYHYFRGTGYVAYDMDDGVKINKGGLTVGGNAYFSNPVTTNAGVVNMADYALRGPSNRHIRFEYIKSDGSTAVDAYIYKDGVDNPTRRAGLRINCGTPNKTSGNTSNSGDFIFAEDGQFILPGGGVINQDGMNANTYCMTALSTLASGSKNYLRKFRGGASNTIWHETVQSSSYTISTGNTDAQAEMELLSGTRATFKGEVVSQNANGLRIAYGSVGFFIRNDGNNTYFMFTNANDQYGSYNNLRPMYINNTNGNIIIGHGATVNGSSLVANAGLGVGTTNGLGSNGIAIGDTDTGFQQAADGVLDAFANSQRIMRWTTGATAVYKQLQVQGINGPALLLNNTAANQSIYVYLQRAGTNAGYMGFGGTDNNMSFHNYILNTTLQLRTSDVYVNRGFYSDGDGNFNNVYIRSDITLKRNFKQIENALDKVEKLDGLIYEKKNSPTSTEYESVEAGIIAQSLQEVLPEAVVEKEGVLNVSASGTIALLVNAIKELKARVEYLESK